MHRVKSHKSIEQIAKKHRLDISFVKHQLEMGVPIEHEHTKDKDLATDIALQHLEEIPDYYTRLKKMEADAKKEHKKFKDVSEAKKMKGEDPCWKGYEMIGKKKKNGKEVPNCVPVKEESKMIRFCPKCAKEENRDECKYGPKYWDMFSMPIKLKSYTPNTPHPGNFPESVDHEHSMARSEISTIISAAKRLKKKIGKGEGNIEAWVQSKITKAADYIDAAADYVDSGEMKEETGVIQKPATPAERKKIAKMKELHRLMMAAKSGRETSDIAKESVNIEDANGNHYAEFIDIIKPEPLKASRGIGSQLVSEEPGDGYIGPARLGIKNPLASDATRASADKKRSAGQSKEGGLVGKMQQRADATDAAIKMLNQSYYPERKSFTQFIDEASAAWQREEGKNPEGGLNKKGIASYRKEHPGSKLSLAVTTKPSKLKKGSKSANRRKSFCSRMSGMKKKLTSAKTANDPNSRINKSLRKWNC